MKEPPWALTLMIVLFHAPTRAQLSQDSSSQTVTAPDVFGIAIFDEEHVIGFIKDERNQPVSPQVQPGVPLSIVIFGSHLSKVHGVTFVGGDSCDNETIYDTHIQKDELSLETSHILRLKNVVLTKKMDNKPYRVCIQWKPKGIDDPETINILVDNKEGRNEISTKEKEREYYLPMPLQCVIIIVLLVLSGLFSGLNLGLMSLDPTELQLIINSGTKNERRYAEIILPVRNTGNFLLCSLLLGNVMVNSAISILFDDLTSGIVALIVSSFGIVIFGEIVPQSICNRKGLAVGAYTIWITKFFMLITSPLAWPISKLLDRILGEEVGRVYNKQRLAELIRMSVGNKAANMGDDFRIVSGALEYTEKTVKDIMTNIDDVFMLSSDVRLNATQVADIIKNGYTRIPVYEDDRNNVVSVLNVKDLALLDPDDNLPVKTVCTYWAHPTRFVMEDTPLKVMLDEFMKGHYHMALVQKIEMREDTDNSYVLSGLVTLEDIIEEILQAEIVDETDVITDNRQKHKRKDTQLKDLSLLLEPNDASYKSDISMQLQLAAVQWLSSNCPPFHSENISNRVLQRLVKRNTRCEKIGDISSAPYKSLYTKGLTSNKFTLILEGRMQVLIGQEEMSFEAGPFHVFGSEVVTNMAQLANKFKGDKDNVHISTEEDTLKVMNRQSAFKPDFSVIINEDVTYVSVSTDDFWQAYKSTCMEKGEKITLSLRLPLSSLKEETRPRSQIFSLPSSMKTSSKDALLGPGLENTGSTHRIRVESMPGESSHSDRHSGGSGVLHLSPRIMRNVQGKSRLRSNSGSGASANPARATISSPKEAQKWLKALKNKKSHLNEKEEIKETIFTSNASNGGNRSVERKFLIEESGASGNIIDHPRRSTSLELLVRTNESKSKEDHGDRV